MNDTKKWLRGLVGAAIGGLSTGVTMVIVDHKDFNLGDGLTSLGQACLVNAIVSAALYLKNHPTPDE